MHALEFHKTEYCGHTEANTHDDMVHHIEMHSGDYDQDRADKIVPEGHFPTPPPGEYKHAESYGKPAPPNKYPWYSCNFQVSSPMKKWMDQTCCTSSHVETSFARAYST